jgi:hypothetical protein
MLAIITGVWDLIISQEISLALLKDIIVIKVKLIMLHMKSKTQTAIAKVNLLLNKEQCLLRIRYKKIILIKL